MSTFDVVKLEKVYCYHCGLELRNKFWKTKLTVDVMKSYNSLEEFSKEYIGHKLENLDLTYMCTKCETVLQIRVYPTLSGIRIDLVKTCTMEHPNHKAILFTSEGNPFYNNLWCTLCEFKEFANGEENIEMSPEHISKSRTWAIKQHETLQQITEMPRIRKRVSQEA